MSILSPVLRTFEISTTPQITSEDYFKEAGVKLMGSNFKAQFLGVEIPPIQKRKLAVRKLKENSLDGPILKELGSKAKISISQFRAFLKAQRESKEWFIFYLEGGDGKIWAVLAHWSFVVDSWYVDANPVMDPDGWYAGDQVVS